MCVICKNEIDYNKEGQKINNFIYSFWLNCVEIKRAQRRIYCMVFIFIFWHFFKINKSYWVNLEHAVGILQHGTRNYCELTNGELLFISKSNLVAFQKLVSLKHATKYN